MIQRYEAFELLPDEECYKASDVEALEQDYKGQQLIIEMDKNTINKLRELNTEMFEVLKVIYGTLSENGYDNYNSTLLIKSIIEKNKSVIKKVEGKEE